MKNKDLEGLAAREAAGFQAKPSIEYNNRKFTKENVDAIVDALCTGLPIKTTCGLVGIDETTFYEWKKNNPGFKEAIEATRAVYESNLIDLIRSNAPNDWRAAAWLLERRHPESWSLKKDISIDVKKSDGADRVIDFLKQSRSISSELESENES